MLGLFLFTLLGVGFVAAAGVFDDGPNEQGDDKGSDACDDYEDWPGSEVRVTQIGENEENHLIETNITDDVYQQIDTEYGVDQVAVGLGDTVDTRVGDSEHSSDYGDDIDGEEGDSVVVRLCEGDLEQSTQLGTEYSEVSGVFRLQEIEGDIPFFRGELGSGDTLEFEVPDSEDGALFVLEGEEQYIEGSAAYGPEWEYSYAYILYSADGTPPPEGLRTDEGSVWFDSSHGPLGQDDLDGFYLIGRLELGTSYYAQDKVTDEVTSWNEPVNSPTIVLTQPNMSA